MRVLGSILVASTSVLKFVLSQGMLHIHQLANIIHALLVIVIVQHASGLMLICAVHVPLEGFCTRFNSIALAAVQRAILQTHRVGLVINVTHLALSALDPHLMNVSGAIHLNC